MNKGKIFGLLALVFFLISLAFGIIFLLSNDKQTFLFNDAEPESLKISNSNKITWGNVNLYDHTIYNPDGSCIAENNGMQVYIHRCNVETISGRNIEQTATFTTNRTGGTTYLFVYDGQLQNGKMFVWRNYSHQYTELVEKDQAINNYLVDGIVSYTDLGTPNSLCKFGNTHNTMMYDVTRTNSTNTWSEIYCFSSRTIVNATAFRISGNISISQYETKTGFKFDYDDITNIVEDVTDSVPIEMRKNFSFYKVNDVSAGTYDIKWIFTPKNNKLYGKWHILAYPTDKGLIQAYQDNDYMYQDPSWNVGLSNSLKLYYNFNSTVDMVTGVHNLTLFGADVNIANGKIPNSIYFDGTTGNYSTFGNKERIKVSSADGFTVNFWTNTTFDSTTGAYKTWYYLTDGVSQTRLFAYGNSPYGNTQGGSCAGTTDLNCGASCNLVNNGVYQMITYVINSTAHTIYQDGVYKISVGLTSCSFNATSTAILGSETSSARNYRVNLDEFSIHNRALSQAEISELYNSGAGLTYADLTGDITVTLNSPVNAYNSSVTTVNLNWTMTPTSVTFTNYTLYVWYLNSTIAYSELNTTINDTTAVTKLKSLTLNDGSYKWGVTACGISLAGNHICTLSSNRTFIIDTTKPLIEIYYPKNNIGLITKGNNISLNFSIIEDNINSCWREYNNVNTTMSCNNNSFVYVPGINNLKVWANDSVNNKNYSSTSWNLIYVNNATYISTAQELSTQSIVLNTTYNSSYYTSASAILYYNNTAYISTKTDVGINTLYSNSINLPLVTSDINLTFYWALQLFNGSDYEYYNTINYTQTVTNIVLDNCGTGTYKLFNFTIYDEDSLTRLLPPTYNNSYAMEIYINDQLTYATNKTGSELAICSTTPITGNLSVDYILSYDADGTSTGYVHEYYNVQNFNLNPSTTNNNISLYDLIATNSEECLFTIKDENFLALDNGLVQITRRYLSDGTYKTVEIPATDSLGKTIGHFVLNDEEYSIYLRKDGNLLATYTNVKAVKPTGSDCIFNLNIPSASSTPEDFTAYGDLLYDSSYDDGTRTYSIDWVTNSGSSSNITLYAYIDGVNVCSEENIQSSGIIQCIFATSYTNQTARIVLLNSGSVVFEDYVSIGYKRANLNPIRYLIAAALIPIMVLMAGSSIIVATVFFIIGLILSGGLFLFDTQTMIGAGSFIMWLVVAGAILLYKFSRRASNG